MTVHFAYSKAYSQLEISVNVSSHTVYMESTDPKVGGCEWPQSKKMAASICTVFPHI